MTDSEEWKIAFKAYNYIISVFNATLTSLSHLHCVILIELYMGRVCCQSSQRVSFMHVKHGKM